MSLDEAKKRVGELLITGFEGLELAEETASFLSQARIGGVILFAQNYDSPAQVADLTNHIQECRADLPLWISVDHEGGRVQRFKKPFTKIPDASAIGASGSPKIAFDIGELIGKELRAVGVNVNFCPVADINTNPRNPVIGPRSYGQSEELVSKMVSAVARGHLTQGVQPCIKHFPGHGDTNTDSHFALPKVEIPLEKLRSRELKPFLKAFKSRVSMVMTAHIINREIDAEYPATLSHKTIEGILRKELRYSKMVISDDMEMKAIVDHFGAEEAPVLAINAGCDALIYRTEKASRHAYEALVKALDSGELHPSIVIKATDRSRALKREVLLPWHRVETAALSNLIGTKEHAEIAGKVVAGA